MFGLRYFVAAPFIFHKAPWEFSYGKFEIFSNISFFFFDSFYFYRLLANTFKRIVIDCNTNMLIRNNNCMKVFTIFESTFFNFLYMILKFDYF